MWFINLEKTYSDHNKQKWPKKGHFRLIRGSNCIEKLFGKIASSGHGMDEKTFQPPSHFLGLFLVWKHILPSLREKEACCANQIGGLTQEVKEKIYAIFLAS